MFGIRQQKDHSAVYANQQGLNLLRRVLRDQLNQQKINQNMNLNLEFYSKKPLEVL